nr:hypothetical protein [Tanacetum cinerariifolium]
EVGCTRVAVGRGVRFWAGKVIEVLLGAVREFGEMTEIALKVDGKQSVKEKEKSEDPFNLYPLLNRKKQSVTNEINSDDSLKHPPGFTPTCSNCDVATQENKGENNDEFSELCEVNNVKGGANGSTSSGHFKVSGIPRTGGSMVGLLEEVVKVGQRKPTRAEEQANAGKQQGTVSAPANETQGWVPDFTDESENDDDNSMDEEGEVHKSDDNE